MLLYDELKHLRRENDELKFEKRCCWALVGLVVLWGIVHFTLSHAPI